MGFQIKSVMMIAGYDPGCGNNRPISINNRQDIAGFGGLRILIFNTFTALFGGGMRPIPIPTGQIQFIGNGLYTLLPHPF